MVVVYGRPRGYGYGYGYGHGYGYGYARPAIVAPVVVHRPFYYPIYAPVHVPLVPYAVPVYGILLGLLGMLLFFCFCGFLIILMRRQEEQQYVIQQEPTAVYVDQQQPSPVPVPTEDQKNPSKASKLNSPQSKKPNTKGKSAEPTSAGGPRQQRVVAAPQQRIVQQPAPVIVQDPYPIYPAPVFVPMVEPVVYVDPVYAYDCDPVIIL
ncbi:unnamed protein product [Caenorhabditis auriculariae]|uniref:Uncharacterized protein n=1 Tax=Caenorhabditis auriculariae TaxID=2777116 RepID=A0A8S1H352_9PELO|nr:unnamed protein product [Caenorhabditis auriculariae]